MALGSPSWVWMLGCGISQKTTSKQNALNLTLHFLELPLSQVRDLFYSESPEDRGKVLVVLAAFRELLEEHVGVDTRQLLGNI